PLGSLQCAIESAAAFAQHALRVHRADDAEADGGGKRPSSHPEEKESRRLPPIDLERPERGAEYRREVPRAAARSNRLAQTADRWRREGSLDGPDPGPSLHAARPVCHHAAKKGVAASVDSRQTERILMRRDDEWQTPLPGLRQRVGDEGSDGSCAHLALLPGGLQAE